MTVSPSATPPGAASPEGLSVVEASPRLGPWFLIAQALAPGLGYLLTRRTLAGIATLAAVPVTVITTHMRIVEGEGDAARRTALWAGLLALLWANTAYRAFVEIRAAPDEESMARRLAGEGPGPLAWLAARPWLVIAGALFLIDRMMLDAEVDFREFVSPENLRALRRIATGLVHPDFSITREIIAKYAWITLEMAVVGTVLGAAVSAPISFLGARNLLGRSQATAPVYYVTRFILGVVRAIPTLIWGLMAISFGLGHFPGVIALSIFSFGLTAKLFSEAIEAIDWGPVEAVTASGANPLHTLWFGVVPQVAPSFISHLLYCLEVNVHSSVVLGLIGAGGLGFIVNEYIATFHWEEASTVLIITIVMTLGIDYGSAYIRSRIV